MATLTLPQIDAILEQARAAGLEPAEVEGLRATLLMRSAQPGNADKLGISISLLPTTQADSVDEFLSAMDTLGKSVLARGRAALEAISDEEWEALINEGTDVQESTQATQAEGEVEQ